MDESDLARALRRMTELEGAKTLLREGKMPCPFGGGECLISSPGTKTGEENGTVYHLVACSKARSARDGFWGTSRREKQLAEMGCPKPTYGMFAGWHCKFADGRWYPI